MRYILLLLALMLFVPIVKSESYENLQVSLLTVKPRSNEIYTIYGHSALRLQDDSTGIDIVFNWGTFDTSKPNFAYYFMRGETDYYLSTVDYVLFCRAYAWGNSTVVEQILNLSSEEKERLMLILEENLKTENRNYRYNFLFDNCTTRIRDIIEDISLKKIEYPEQQKTTTFRELIYSCTSSYPWMSFGINLIIGSGADSIVNTRQEMFLPEHLMDVFRNSVVGNYGESRENLVLSELTVMESTSVETPKNYFWTSPLFVGVAVFLLYLILILLYNKHWKLLASCFALYFCAATIGGIIIFFLVFFSAHPCVSPNWNLVWLNPLHIVGVVGFFFKKTHSLFYWYHRVNFVLLCLFLVAWFLIPQKLEIAIIPYVITLATISGYSLFRKKQIKK
ncbi:DUF4105 domain-containing protein [Bacteroidales bacterium OttesenSCG-928-M11]|nr:DUF4105 domain-containing protein [Bacteroidales bacterium OttesenSCG-928-M11]